ncbi:hypothetical protein GCM10018781_38390 [Kitasatospora indigofera]|uniref:Uncharacterized protein n=1 Tax=Kitasatospora indigofera TaxID=67307 RepID=A0A919FXI4_9ACTN|nr:hypothetical protein GCM10018781_38390 [Kitasatospora indigofera]
MLGCRTLGRWFRGGRHGCQQGADGDRLFAVRAVAADRGGRECIRGPRAVRYAGQVSLGHPRPADIRGQIRYAGHRRPTEPGRGPRVRKVARA